MVSFFIISFIGLFVISVTWIVTYEVLGLVWNILPKLTINPRLRVLLIGVPIFGIHFFGIWAYALTFFLIENYTDLGRLVGERHAYGVNLQSFMDCLYFSAATYTSLGLGDLVPTHDMRMLISAEVLNGLVIIGWTISFTYLTMEKFWALPKNSKNKK